MLHTRTASIILGILTTCVPLYYLATTITHQTSIDPNMATPLHQEVREPSVDDLHIFLSHTWQPVPTVKVTIQNTHPTAHMSFLIWDTPIDRTALNTGVISLIDAISNQLIPGPGLKINRMLPPPGEALVELAPQDVVDVDIDLDASWIPDDNKLVKVHAQGEWRAVWAKAKDDITSEELSAMSGPDVLSGPFRSVRDVELELELSK